MDAEIRNNFFSERKDFILEVTPPMGKNTTANKPSLISILDTSVVSILFSYYGVRCIHVENSMSWFM